MTNEDLEKRIEELMKFKTGFDYYNNLKKLLHEFGESLIPDRSLPIEFGVFEGNTAITQYCLGYNQALDDIKSNLDKLIK